MTILLEFQVSQIARCADDIAGYLTGAKLHLTLAAVDINPGTTLAALHAEEATYATYLAQVLLWDVPTVSSDGTVESVATPLVFRPTDNVTPNQIYAVYITDGASAILYFAKQLDEAPVPMTSPLDQMVITVRFRPATQSIVVTIT
jgi:hypothetical protein